MDTLQPTRRELLCPRSGLYAHRASRPVLAPARDLNTGPVPTALDLADVTAEDVTPARRPSRTGSKPHPAGTPPAVQAAADDISDWL